MERGMDPKDIWRIASVHRSAGTVLQASDVTAEGKIPFKNQRGRYRVNGVFSFLAVIIVGGQNIVGLHSGPAFIP